jgi:hypothetical protein
VGVKQNYIPGFKPESRAPVRNAWPAAALVGFGLLGSSLLLLVFLGPPLHVGRIDVLNVGGDPPVIAL